MTGVRAKLLWFFPWMVIKSASAQWGCIARADALNRQDCFWNSLRMHLNDFGTLWSHCVCGSSCVPCALSLIHYRRQTRSMCFPASSVRLQYSKTSAAVVGRKGVTVVAERHVWLHILESRGLKHSHSSLSDAVFINTTQTFMIHTVLRWHIITRVYFYCRGWV